MKEGYICYEYQFSQAAYAHMDITECKGAKGEFGLGCSVGKYVLGSYMYPHVVAF